MQSIAYSHSNGLDKWNRIQDETACLNLIGALTSPKIKVHRDYLLEN